ncbi:MAG: hypothetical protein LBT09_12090 [Planctomycetaceae bacterium]|jgi:hypothetical protein|nr:hypothetical protein [Planctomycetaceae bacterium]
MKRFSDGGQPFLSWQTSCCGGDLNNVIGRIEYGMFLFMRSAMLALVYAIM